MPIDFEQLVQAHYEKLYRFALSLSRHPSDAADLTQQTFVMWAERGHQLRDQKKVKSWLFTTLYREFLRGKRRYDRFPHLELVQAEGELPKVSAQAVNQLEAQEVLNALSELDDVFRDPLSLFFIGDHSYKEIAATLRIPIGTVMSRIARGKTQLKQRLQEKMSKEEWEENTLRVQRGNHE